MFRQALIAAVAATMLATTAGCYQNQQASAADQAAQAQADRDAAKARALAASQTAFVDAVAASKDVQAKIGAKNWEAADDALTLAQQRVEALLNDATISMDVRAQVAALVPTINQAHVAVMNHAAQAPQTAAMLAKQFDRTAQTLVSMGWLPAAGGGAGTGTTVDPTTQQQKDLDQPDSTQKHENMPH
jgi:hypothetical protein